MDEQMNSATDTAAPPKTNLPLSAFVLGALPYLMLFIDNYLFDLSHRAGALFYLVLWLAPAAGFVLGIAMLRRGKARIGSGGKRFALGALILPLPFIIAGVLILLVVTRPGYAPGM